MPPSRGVAMSAYLPPFNPKTSAKVYGNNIQSGVITSAHIADGTVVAADVGAGAITSAKLGTGAVTSAKIASSAVRNTHVSAKAITSAKIRAAFLSGSIVSGKMVRAIAHGLGVKPKFAVVCPIATLTQASGAQNVNISIAAASAATSTNVYVIGSQTQNTAMKYSLYVQL